MKPAALPTNGQVGPLPMDNDTTATTTTGKGKKPRAEEEATSLAQMPMGKIINTNNSSSSNKGNISTAAGTVAIS
jgi:hypothetical protein